MRSVSSIETGERALAVASVPGTGVAPRRSRVFGIGFHKTGTTSLARALEHLGYRTAHGAGPLRAALGHPAMMELLRTGELGPVWALAETFDAFADNPWFQLFREADARFPGSRFVLTRRNPERWLGSVVNHFGGSESDFRRWTYGAGDPVGNEELVLERYRAHEAAVLAHFAHRPEDLLLMDVEQGDGWAALCGFLGHAVPGEAFPHENRRRRSRALARVGTAVRGRLGVRERRGRGTMPIGRGAAPERASSTFAYRAHGLSLLSEVELPEATPTRFDDPNVTIRHGATPPALAAVHDEGAGHQVAPGAYRLEVTGVGVYGLQGGREIVVATLPDASPEAVREPLLASVMGAAVHESGLFALHASAVAVEDGCVLFTGVPGAGKSTLAAAFQAVGLPVISDDLVAIEISASGAPLAHPGYRVVKLRSDAVDRFGSSFGAARPLECQPGKFSVRIPGSPAETPLPVRAIFDLGTPTLRLSLEAVTGATKVRTVLGRMYRSRMVPALGHADRTFVMAAAIARGVPVWSLRIPRAWDALARAVTEVRRVVAASSR